MSASRKADICPRRALLIDLAAKAKRQRGGDSREGTGAAFEALNSVFSCHNGRLPIHAKILRCAYRSPMTRFDPTETSVIPSPATRRCVCDVQQPATNAQ
jgi:hypothetical protein